MTIVAFEAQGLGCATDELRDLGKEFAFYVLRHCQNVKLKPGVHRQFQVYARYEEVDLYRAQIERKFAIYAVEQRDNDDVKVTIMFAGEDGRPVFSGEHVWRGESDDELRLGILKARTESYFF